MKEVIIIGGGLAGLVNAIALRKAGLDVTVIEKKEYPFHKVCGEYVSNEVLGYLQTLGIDPFSLNAKRVTRFMISSPSGAAKETALPLGGFSVSRFALDNYLYEIATTLGVEFCLKSSVASVDLENNSFRVRLSPRAMLEARVVIGAHGKRSVLDNTLNRDFFNQRTNWIGVKHHFKADFPDDLVCLHNFDNGYCGLSRVENDHVNVCYLTTAKNLKTYGSVPAMERDLLSKNPHLRHFFQSAEAVFENPLVISQVSFSPKQPVEAHILMSGDSAGLIHPLCGNGMAMAIHSAKICSELVVRYFDDKMSREELERSYAQQWRQAFQHRLFVGRHMQKLFGRNLISELSMGTLRAVPGLLKTIIKNTHGEPIA